MMLEHDSSTQLQTHQEQSGDTNKRSPVGIIIKVATEAAKPAALLL
jgi:hypothetical protein